MNSFGTAFVQNGETWNATLASKDSDGDGFTNGQELGDPTGAFTPIVGAQITNPGDRNSKPATGTVPTITAQPANQTVTAGASVTFTVAATGTAPLTYQWKKAGVNITGATSATLTLNAVTAASAGSYTVTVANSAGSVTSAAANLTVNPLPPTELRIVLLSPTNGATFAASAEIPLVTSVQGGTDAEVEFFDGTNLLGVVTEPPYTLVVRSLAVGDHMIRARVTDAQNNSSVSEPAIIIVDASQPESNPAPMVQILFPRNASKLNAGNRVYLLAKASDEDGVQQVEFFAGSTSIGRAIAISEEDLDDDHDGRYEAKEGRDGYQKRLRQMSHEDDDEVDGDDHDRSLVLYILAWNRIPAGEHLITARATDRLGAISTSAPVKVTVKRPARRLERHDD